MRTRILVFLIALSPSLAAAPPAKHFYVEGRHLYDRCGERVVLRGVNKMNIWTDPDGIPSFAEIAKTGANAVRIVWLTTSPASEFDETLSNALAAHLIPILDMHDATGDWEKLDDVVDYWVRPDTVEVIRKHEPYLLINIANEAGRDVRDDVWVAGYRDAIARMRAAGIRVPLIIDAAGWGRDVEQLLRLAPEVLETDRDLVFSWHAWDTSGDQASRVTRSLERAVEEGIPLIVGEFAHAEVGCKPGIPYRHILAEAQRLGIGWLAWSWGPGNQDCPAMDMTEDGTYQTLHAWGKEVALTDPNSICMTSRRPRSMTSGACGTARRRLVRSCAEP
ncbi:MAG TPA: cellulase family glycosylhydrolase [Thermoanaerobaculia bacterium]